MKKLTCVILSGVLLIVGLIMLSPVKGDMMADNEDIPRICAVTAQA